MTLQNIATEEERIVDENYKSVFVLNRAQVESHLCSTEPERKGMTNMRVRKDDTGNYIVTESTDGKCLIQVMEKLDKSNIEHYPLDVNPSETTKVLLEEAQYIPVEVLETIAKGFPKRKNFCAQPWQRTVVVSVNDLSKEIEVGRSSKQGKPQVDSFAQSEWTAYPPVDQVWPKGDPAVSATFNVKLLKRVLEAVERAGGELVTVKQWDDKTALQIESVNKYGHTTERDIKALIMPATN